MKTWWCLLILGICVLDGGTAQESTEMQPDKARDILGLFSLDFSTKFDVTKSCGGSSDVRKTIWQNSDYPKSEELPGLCSLHLTPPADTCAYRVLFDDLDLRSGEKDAWIDMIQCNPSAPYFKATTQGDLGAVHCQNMDGLEGILHVDPDTTEPVVLLLQLDPDTKMKFRVNATAVSCDDIKTYESPQDCGIKQNLRKLRRERLRAGDDEGSQESDASPGKQSRRIYKNKKKQQFSPNISPLIQISKIEVTKLEDEGVLKKVKRKGEKTLGLVHSVHEYPWNVYIASKIGERLLLPCNGILVGNDKVLTSRSCALWTPQQPISVENMKVYIGDHDVFDPNDVESVTSTVSKITVPLTNGLYDLDNAFAIVHLNEKLEFSDTIKPICMPVDYNNFRKNSGVIAGWLFANEIEVVYGVPREADVFLTDDKTCLAQMKFLKENFDYEGKVNIQYAPDDILCTLDQIWNDGDVCLGEGGNPLIQRDQTGAYYLTGMSSALNICLEEDFPTVFTKVDANNQFLNIALA